jgi:hypothetical protein
MPRVRFAVAGFLLMSACRKKPIAESEPPERQYWQGIPVKPGVSPCPSSAPAKDAPCDRVKDYAECSYGQEPELPCRRHARCYGTPSTGAKWTYASIPAWCADAEAVCHTATVSEGSACATKAICNMADGSNCYCRQGRWSCSRTNHPDCPGIAPSYGSPCNKELRCHYGPVCAMVECAEGNDARGLWQPTTCIAD